MSYSVHNEEGFARVYTEDDMVEIRRGDLRAILDVATGSMDFGSGFLDNEQVEAIRLVAQKLDIDPMLVTPYNFACLYKGEHEWKWQPNWRRPRPVGQSTREELVEELGRLEAGMDRGAWYCPLCHHTDLERPAPASTEENLNKMGLVVMKSPIPKELL